LRILQKTVWFSKDPKEFLKKKMNCRTWFGENSSFNQLETASILMYAGGIAIKDGSKVQ